MQRTKIWKILVFLPVLLLGCSRSPEDVSIMYSASGASGLQDRGGYLETVTVEGVQAYALSGYEMSDGVVYSYMDGLSVDVRLLNDADSPTSAVEIQAELYREYVEKLGYEHGSLVVLSDEGDSLLTGFDYAGMVDGIEAEGHYLFHASRSGSVILVYCVNIPLSGIGSDGKVALEELLVVFEDTVGI